MIPAFLIPESVVREDGSGPEVCLGASQGKMLVFTLGITRIIEQESLEVAILGSTDGANWIAKPLLAFPQKFYCGTYRFELDLAQNPDVKYLKAQWKVNRWGRGESKPLFGVYLAASESNSPLAVSYSIAG